MNEWANKMSEMTTRVLTEYQRRGNRAIFAKPMPFRCHSLLVHNAHTNAQKFIFINYLILYT